MALKYLANLKRPLIRGTMIASVAVIASQAHAQIADEIVVTAQKRDESASNVGISISAYNDEQIRALGVTSPRDIAEFTPNMNVKNATGAGNPIFNLRGLGITAFTGNANPTVGVYV
ncbi:MAG: Plug domain-containing protein [Novosphingobium sp.]